MERRDGRNGPYQLAVHDPNQTIRNRVQPESSPRPTAVRSLFRDIPHWEVAFAIIVLLLSSRPQLELIGIKGSGDAVRSNPVEQAIWLPFYGISAWMLVSRSRGRTLHLGTYIFCYIVVLWATYSLFWTSAFDVSLKRWVALLGSTVVGTYVGLQFSRRQLFGTLLWVTALAAALSLILELLDLSHAGDSGAWQGIYAHKNWLGRMMALSASAWLLAFLDKLYPRVLSAAIFAVSLVLVLLSDSAASLAVVCVLVAMIPLLLTSRLHPGVRGLSLTLLVLSGTVLALRLSPDSESIFSALGRDSTLTGRSDLWAYLWPMFQRHAWAGHGYGGFWLGWDGPSAEIWSKLHWHPQHAHNGFYDILLELGLVGMALFILAFLANLIQVIRHLSDRTSITSIFPVLFLAFLILSNVAESNLLTHNSIFWILFTAFSVQLARQFGESRVRGRQEGASVASGKRPARIQPGAGRAGVSGRYHGP